MKAQVCDLGFHPFTALRLVAGQDLNLRPSGYELAEQLFGLCRLVSLSASEQGSCAGDMFARTAP